MGVEAWFKEKIRDDVARRLTSNGGLLDGTMKTGENVAGTVKFPVSGGRIVMYELSGGVEEVRPQNLNVDVISLQARDYTAEAVVRNQDTLRSSASYQAEVAKGMASSVRRKRDQIKLDALNAFANATSSLTDTPSTVTTIGDGTLRIDLLHLSQAIAQLDGAGADDQAEIWYPIPSMWFNQLMWYKEFASSDYQGSNDLPLAQSSRVKRKTFNGVHIISIPDEHFVYGTAAWQQGQSAWDDTKYLDTFMWINDAVGCETFWSKENMDINEWIGKAGKPLLCDTALSGAAVGLLPEGVKRIRMKAIKDIIRP